MTLAVFDFFDPAGPLVEVEVAAGPFHLAALEVHRFAADELLGGIELSGLVAVADQTVGVQTFRVEEILVFDVFDLSPAAAE